MASVVFVGSNRSLVTNAKHVVFQEPVTATHSSAGLVNHDIYFRAEGNTTLQKIQPFHYDDIILHSLSFTPEHKQDSSQHIDSSQHAGSSKHIDSSQPHLPQPESIDSQSEHIDSPQPECIDSPQPEHIDSPQPERIDSQSEHIDSPQPECIDSPQPEHIDSPQPEHDTSQYTASSQNAANYSSQLANVSFSGLPTPDYSQFFQQSAKLKEFIKFMKQHDTTGKNIELFNVFDFDSDQCSKEILRAFIKNVSLCVFVADLSEELNENEIRMFEENEHCSLRGLIIGSSSKSETRSKPYVIKKSGSNPNYVICHHPERYHLLTFFPLNSQQPGLQDDKTGAQILTHALSSSVSKEFPLSWYYFGFKIQEIMTSNNLSVVSVSDCMGIAKELSMDRPTAIAALEHLTENSMLLYFRDALEDTVFAGMHIFSSIFSELFKTLHSKENKYSGLVSKADMDKATKYYTSKIISTEDFVTLFSNLMILAPYNNDYILPSQLQLLNERELMSAVHSSLEAIYIKCPSSGYEYICMLTVFLLTVPSPKWGISKIISSNVPLCLYKNCVKFVIDAGRCAVTITFREGFLEVYVELGSESEYSTLFNVILQGLEKIKLSLNRFQHQHFDYNISFRCDCGIGKIHKATFDWKLGELVCEEDHIGRIPNSWHTIWKIRKPGKLLYYKPMALQ